MQKIRDLNHGILDIQWREDRIDIDIGLVIKQTKKAANIDLRTHQCDRIRW